MSDEVLNELWAVKDSIAKEHGNDVESLVAHLRRMARLESERVLDSVRNEPVAEQNDAADAATLRR